jgi:hemerythrin-like domain-containing protein
MTLALTIIRDEHRALASVLKGLQYLVDQAMTTGRPPDATLLRAIVAYIEQYPDRLHHPKEDLYLFPALRARDIAAGAALDELEHQHQEGPDVIGRVKQALVACEADARQVSALKAAVDAYADFQWAHMRKEEEEILPLAERVLLAEDWKHIDAAFLSNQDPMVGVDRQQEFRDLFRRVVNLMPAPMGLGPSSAD